MNFISTFNTFNDFLPPPLGKVHGPPKVKSWFATDNTNLVFVTFMTATRSKDVVSLFSFLKSNVCSLQIIKSGFGDNVSSFVSLCVHINNN